MGYLLGGMYKVFLVIGGLFFIDQFFVNSKMISKEEELNKIVDKLCEGKAPEYKTFIKRMILSMSEGDKWEKLSELNNLTEKIKNIKS